jgi:HK97 family phage major capsid protein
MHPQVIKLSKEIDALKAEGDALLNAAEFTDAAQERLEAIKAQVEANRRKIDSIESARETMRTAVGPFIEVADELDKQVAAGVAFKSLGEQLLSVRSAALNPSAVDRRLLALNAAASGAQELVGTDGGYLVQGDFSTVLLERLHSTGAVMSRVRRIPIGPNSNRLQMNRVAESSRATGSRWGAVRVYNTAEAGSLTGARPKFEPFNLELEKYAGLFYATNEMMQDAMQLGAIASTAFAEEFDIVLSNEVVRGNGAGQMLGIIPGDTAAGPTVQVSKEAGQAAATIVPENIFKMVSRLTPDSLANAVFFINQDVWPALFTLSLSVGTGGVPVFLPPGGISAAPFGTLLGRPIVPIEQCATLGTVGDIILADLSKYLVIEKGGVQTDTSIHVAFTTDETAFRFILRTNGAPMFKTTITPFKGSNTQGDFVVLETRS